MTKLDETREAVADALAQTFKSAVEAGAQMPFYETGVTVPNREVWLRYADAAITSYMDALPAGSGLADQLGECIATIDRIGRRMDTAPSDSRALLVCKDSLQQIADALSLTGQGEAVPQWRYKYEEAWRDGQPPEGHGPQAETRTLYHASPIAEGMVSAPGDLSLLRKANIERQTIWCPDEMPDLSFRGNELSGEVGEACNVIKKLERERHGWRGSRDTKEHLAEELADVVICADLCAITAGIDLASAVVAKFNATSDKVGIPVKLPAAPTKKAGEA